MREVPALARGIRILELLAERRAPLRIAEIASTLSIPRSATYELIGTLLNFRMVDQTADGLIFLGPKLYMLGQGFVGGVDLGRLSNETAVALRDSVDETIQVAILDQRFVLYIAKADSSHHLRLVSNVGRRLPAHVTGLGKALIASLPDADFEALFDGVELEQFTPTSIGTMPQLREEVKLIRKQGYAIDDCESTPGVRCVAAPIFDSTGAAVAAISISVPESRMTPELVEAHAINVKVAAAEMSARLGFVPSGSIK